jgi:serine/threonine protein kinase
MLAGSPPYVATNQVALSDNICHEHPPALPPNCPPQLALIITRALQKLPDLRPSMEQFFHMINSVCRSVHEIAPTVSEPLLVETSDNTRYDRYMLNE